MMQFFIGFVIGIVFSLLIVSALIVAQEEEEENLFYDPDVFEQDQANRRKLKWH